MVDTRNDMAHASGKFEILTEESFDVKVSSILTSMKMIHRCMNKPIRKWYEQVLLSFCAGEYEEYDEPKDMIAEQMIQSFKLSSPYDNGDYIYSENGCPMDFVSAMRFQDEMYEWWMSLSEEEREQELRELRGDYDTVSDSIIIDTEWSDPAMDPDAELPFS